MVTSCSTDSCCLCLVWRLRRSTRSTRVRLEQASSRREGPDLTTNRRSDARRFRVPALSCETVVSVISLRSLAAWGAIVGGGLWLAQGVVLIARGGTEPDPRIEAVTFSCGFVALVAAAGIASWVSSAAKSTFLRAALAVLAALSVPLAVFLGQAAAFALPGSHWLESDAMVLVIALTAITCGISSLRRRAHLG